MRIRMWRGGIPVADADIHLDTVCEALADPEVVVWLHVVPDDLDELADRLSLHAQAVEDARKEHGDRDEIAQRTKLDRFAGHVFAYLYLARMDADADLTLEGVPVFVNRHWMITVARAEGLDPDDLERRIATYPELLRHGTPALFYAVLDLVVDSHLGAVDVVADRVDAMEELLFDGSSSDDPSLLARQSFAVRKALVRLRRVVAPMREIVGSAIRRDEEDSTPVDAFLQPYFQDVYDHVLRVNDTIEGLRDLLTTIYETRIAMADHVLNSVTKKLAAWAAIIAVPTAVTGFFGQNIPYPFFNESAGFWISTGLWGSVSVSLYVVFRRRDWL